MPTMPIAVNFKHLIQYTILAATTAQSIAERDQVPFLRSAAALSLSITKSVETIRSKKEEFVEIIEQIHEILCIIVKLHSTSEINGILPTTLLYVIAKFTEALEKLFTVLNGKQKGTLGKIKGLFRQPEAGERLQTCKQELSRTVELFKAQVTGSTLAQMGQMKQDAKEQHEQLVALLETDSDLTGSDHSSVVGTLSSLGNNSSDSFGLLPPCPQIFHGRESELKDVVNILVQDSAHIAILGAGGMGKTVLLQWPSIIHKWKPTTIATHIGLEKGSKMANKIAHYFAHAPPSLLVLDNLETTWEALSSRSEVEEFLSLLTDVPQLGLMITLRGAERPSKVKWARPFLAPLKPLSHVAAWQTFIEVADEGHDDASIKELLGLIGNLPLAVSLIASAQELLSILSLLPDGLADADLVQAKLPIPDILACKATLIQTALAFVGQDQHLKVLVPIREHILCIHPPADALKLKLREHFHNILDLWNQFKNLNVADVLPQISQNLGNFNTVLRDGLEREEPDIVQNLRSILFLNLFSSRFQQTYSPLLLQLSGQMLHWKDNQIFGEYLIQLLETSECLPDLDLNSEIILGTQHFTSQDPLEQGRWYRALGVYFQYTKSDLAGALQYFQTAYSLAESTGYPTIVGFHALTSICGNLLRTGKPLSALKHAEEAYRYAEHIGNIHGQAWSLRLQGTSHIYLANYWHAQHLLQKSRHILATLSHQQSRLNLHILNLQAEIHLMKSEYLESHKLQVTIISSCQATSYHAILANLNNAFIDITTGNLNITQSHLKALYGYLGRHLCTFSDYIAAELCLRDGSLGTGNALFEKGFKLFLDIDTNLALLCAERLGDLSTGMNDIPTTLRWTGISLGLALKCKDKRQTMQAFRCLGQIFSVEGDDETALSLYRVALEGFTFMDVHRWRADCMVRIGDILNNRGEVIKAIELWKTATPLFERSSQMKDVVKIDTKIAEVDSAILAKYEEQLQHLSELHVPVSALEEAYITEEEEEENKLAQGSDIWDKGRHGVLV
ncbi:hypothetical protein C8J57DRAFT_1471812 [Mycena rebaudengoi]|nr:hypothetical protein C8J57DRAFT_1471812 [Mycena rebaudengoi]